MDKKLFFIISSVLLLDRMGFAQELRDVKPPVVLPYDFSLLFLLLVLPLLIALFFLIRYLVKRLKRHSIKKPVILPKPWEIAYQELEQLKKDNLPSQGKIKEFYSRLSNIARLYIERRFCIKAPEMTTEEFLSSLKVTQALNASQKSVLEEFLICCDMVKFAKYSSNDEEIEHSFEVVKKFVDETKEEAAGVNSHGL